MNLSRFFNRKEKDLTTIIPKDMLTLMDYVEPSTYHQLLSPTLQNAQFVLANNDLNPVGKAQILKSLLLRQSEH